MKGLVLWRVGDWRCELGPERRLTLFNGDEEVAAEPYQADQDVEAIARAWREAAEIVSGQRP